MQYRTLYINLSDYYYFQGIIIFLFLETFKKDLLFRYFSMKNYLRPLIGGMLLFGASNVNSDYYVSLIKPPMKTISFYNEYLVKSSSKSKNNLKIDKQKRLNYILKGVFNQKKGIIQEKFDIIDYYIDVYLRKEKSTRYLTIGSNGISGLNKIYGRNFYYSDSLEKFLDIFKKFEYNLYDLYILSNAHEFIESEGNTRAYSNKKAIGSRQFLDYVGINYGLKFNNFINEAYCPVKSTKAAMKYISEYTEEFNSVEYGLLAYVYSPSKVRKLVEKKNFWEINRFDLPKDAYDYVLKIFAVMDILKNKKEYGLDIYPEYIKTRIYKVKKGETMSSIADKFNKSIEDIMRTNILRDDSNIPDNYLLKIPIKS